MLGAPPYLRAFDSGVLPPAMQSCRPKLSAVIDASTRPMSDSRSLPWPIRAVHCTFTVSGTLSRSARW